MNKTLCVALAVSLSAVVAGAYADDAHHPEGSAPAVKTVKQQIKGKELNAQVQRMKAAKLKMLAAKTPDEKNMAMMEGMSSMKDGMHMMSKMHNEHHPEEKHMMDMMMQMMDQESSMMMSKPKE